MPKILIVDDDEAFCGFLRQRLEDSYEVAHTSNPEDALATALKFKPDCILLDLMMPTLSGMELCQTLKSLSFTSSIPILIITGQPTEKFRDCCTELGAIAYFVKPFDIELLKEGIASAVKSKKTERRDGSRVRLKIMLNLRGIDTTGKKYEVVTSTENVSVNGFFCGLDAHLRTDSVAEVFLGTGADRFIGRVRVARIERRAKLGEFYGFEFTQKTDNWLLR